ncbi:hypothetical protein HMPREF9372_0802 [Sporosarcina newyorkensis 2681]|uniref:Uncharacterized protein n=1 Tax=Sporosarcina newyorkensis 2681 TaxID=1027292 RepID=F9DPS2_9BACL|nr:hypothetical protein HMPREF9372_0802 [Sporosarcina newyorkensis 2681]
MYGHSSARFLRTFCLSYHKEKGMTLAVLVIFIGLIDTEKNGS